MSYTIYIVNREWSEDVRPTFIGAYVSKNDAYVAANKAANDNRDGWFEITRIDAALPNDETRLTLNEDEIKPAINVSFCPDPNITADTNQLIS